MASIFLPPSPTLVPLLYHHQQGTSFLFTGTIPTITILPLPGIRTYHKPNWHRIPLILQHFRFYAVTILDGTCTIALWSGTNKNKDVRTGPLARPFAHLFAPLTRLLRTARFAGALRCAHLFARLYAFSLPRLWESELLMSQNDLVLSHSASSSECVPPLGEKWISLTNLCPTSGSQRAVKPGNRQ